LGIDTRVGVFVKTITLADLNLDSVGSSSEVGVGLDIPLNVVLTGGLSVVDLLITLSLTTRGDDGNSEETRASSVGDGVQSLDLEGGSDGTRRGGHSDGGEGDSSSINLGAGVELLAVPDGIGVSLVNDVNELLDSNKIAKEVASNIEDSVGDKVAQVVTSSNNTTVQDLIEQNVKSLVHNLEANIAAGISLDLGRGNGGALGDTFIK